MSWLLTPGAFALAAALTVPPLVLLYFLKLRRREMAISSTFFWKQAVQDLQVNAPFQRLRRNLLLLLQLLVLLLCAGALGQPLLRRESREQRSLVLLIDRSASMNVLEEDGKTRLQRAKEEARKVVRQMEDVDRAMVIGFSDRAQVVTPFSKNRALLDDRIDSIQPTQGLSRLREAVALAEAHAETQIVPSRGGSDTPIINDIPVQLMLFSDGRVEDAGEVSVERMAMQLINPGVREDNVGIVSMRASRSYERPEVIQVVAAVQNFGPQPVEIDIELFIADDHMDIQTVQLGPGMPAEEGQPIDELASTATVTFPASDGEDLVFSGSGVIEVVLRRDDALGADNRALAVIPPPRELSVLLVTDGNYILEPGLASLPCELEIMSPREYEKAAEETLTEGGRSRFDVVVFDDHDTERLPLGAYFFFGGMPLLEVFERGPEHSVDSVFDWDDAHPVLRYVPPHNVVIFKWHEVALPTNAVSLVDVTEGTVLSTVNHQGSRYLISGFPSLISYEGQKVPNSTWAARQHFIVFLYNAVQFLAGQLDVGVQTSLRPGDTRSLEVPEGTGTVRVVRPDGRRDSVLVGNLTTAHYGRTDRIGVYTASPTRRGSTSFAVNLFSEVESRVQPVAQFVVGGSTVGSRETSRIANLPLWPVLLLVALAFLLLEWAVYSRRIRI